jgi:HEPN domain-containing protein
MSGPTKTARTLLRKADDHRKMAAIGMQHNAPLEPVCFHIQQTAEKLLQALLESQGVEYPITHDLRDLLDLATTRFLALAGFYEALPLCSDFEPSREEAQAAMQVVEKLRAVVYSLLPADLKATALPLQ